MTSPPHYTAEESLAMDRWLESRGFSVAQLMAQAGLRVAQAAHALMDSRSLTRAVFLVGPGNNGGDALVAEEWLRNGRLDGMPAGAQTLIVRPLEGDVVPELDAHDLVVDGLFGVGLERPITGAARATVETLNASAATVLSVDVPSGLSPDDGRIVGVDVEHPEGGVAVAADHTLTFVGPKQGFFVGRGPELVGVWSAVEIGFPAEEAHNWVRCRRLGGGDPVT